MKRSMIAVLSLVAVMMVIGVPNAEAKVLLPGATLQNPYTDWTAVNVSSASTYDFQSAPTWIATTVTITNLGTCWADGNGTLKKDVAWFDLGVGNTPGPWAGSDGIWASAVADFGPTDDSFYYPDSVLHAPNTQVIFHDWTPADNNTTVRNCLKFHLQDYQGQDEMGTGGVRANVLYWQNVALPDTFTFRVDFSPDLDGAGGNAVFTVSDGSETITLNSMRWEDDLSNVHVWAGLANSGSTWVSGTSSVTFGDVTPEPATLALLALGGLALLRRKRKA